MILKKELPFIRREKPLVDGFKTLTDASSFLKVYGFVERSESVFEFSHYVTAYIHRYNQDEKYFYMICFDLHVEEYA